ncbi:helix-turn-helix transcriptional regulator [Terrabacter terrigena]|uniref:LuxR C-terminal-related transcriptional regulator n=1 Tax=Terrabacter terrigena TaxID=574718 RepID=A0ABW3MRV4_9MICO
MTPTKLLPTRRREVDALVERVGAPAPATSTLVVVTAPAGGGLTTFLRAFTDECGEDSRVPASRVQRLLGLPWERAQPGAALRSLLPARDRSESVFSPLSAAEDMLAEVTVGAEGWDLVVVLEDAHHTDTSSVQSLVSLTRRPGAARVLVVLGWCDENVGVPARGDDTAYGLGDGLLHDMVLAAADHVVRLAPLAFDDVTPLAERRGLNLPALQVERLLRHCGGRVRNVVEMLDVVAPRDWEAPLLVLPAPPTAARAVRAAVTSLGDDARRLVQSVAVLELGDRQAHGVEVSQAAEVAAVGAATLAVRECVREGLLRQLDELGCSVRLEDPVSRRAVLDAIEPGDRAALHLRAAAVVPDPAVALRHTWFADPRPDAALATRLEVEATRKATDGAWAAAADLLLVAARASADRDLSGARLVAAVDALVGAGDVPRAARFLAEVETLRETPQRDAALGYLAVVRGRPAEAEHKLRRAWDLVNERRDPTTAAVVAQRHVLHALARCRALDVVEWADRAAAVAPGTPAAMEAAAIRGLGVAAGGDVATALAEYEYLLARLPEGLVAQRVVMASGWLHLVADDPDSAVEELERAAASDPGGGSLRISLWAWAWLARAQFATGDWTAAVATASNGADLARRSGTQLLVPLMEWTRTQVYALRGDWAAAEHSACAGEAGTRGYAVMRVPAALGCAALSEARADYAGVVRALTPLTQPWARGWIDAPGFWPWADVHANALVLVGRSEDADAFLRLHEERAAAAAHDSASARLACARGRWHGSRGDLDAARECFERALALLAPLPLAYDRARVHFSYGQTLRRAGRRAEADVVLATAREEYLALGAATYVARCDRELAAGGVHVVRQHREHDELTTQEEVVASLVASGRTNKEVAAELFLSAKTVQYHLTRIYAKLGVRSRSELAALRSQPAPQTEAREPGPST